MLGLVVGTVLAVTEGDVTKTFPVFCLSRVSPPKAKFIGVYLCTMYLENSKLVGIRAERYYIVLMFYFIWKVGLNKELSHPGVRKVLGFF